MNLSENCSAYRYKEASILEGSFCGAGTVLCAASIILAVSLKLHRQLIYRLAIYQVASALAYGITCILDAIQLPIITYAGSVYRPLCLANAFLNVYVFSLKLVFTFVLTVHLFFFAVCYKNLKKLEVYYVTFALLIPAILAAVPFITNTYGEQFHQSPWCWIQETYNCSRNINKAGIIEAFVLVYGPIVFICSAVLILIIVMLIVLMCRSFSKSKVSKKNRVAMKQMLPLLSYPIIFSVLIALTLISPFTKYEWMLNIVDQAAYGGFVWSAGLALFIHIGVMLKLRSTSARRYSLIPPSSACGMISE